MTERPILTMVILLVIPVLIIFHQERKRFRINKIFNFRKELKRIKRKKFAKVKDAKNSTFIGITAGKKQVRTPDNAKHIFICGTTGSGKTVALSNYIKSGVEKDYPMLIVDGKGDTGERFYI